MSMSHMNMGRQTGPGHSCSPLTQEFKPKTWIGSALAQENVPLLGC